MPEPERAKDAAWRSAHEEHPQQLSAMRAYVDEVTREVPDFLLMAPEEDASDDQLAKVKNDLSACGINEADAPPPPPTRDVFEAARAGAASLKAFGDLSTDVNTIDDYHLTPLIHAVDAEREDSARLLLDAGADVNKPDDDGSTPLHYAALLGSIPLATLLADRGADRSLKDGDGNTAADVARSEGHSSLAELLT
jgi:ankyrin repeat protein